MKDFSESIQKLETEIETAEAIVIGAGAGISVSFGFIQISARRLHPLQGGDELLKMLAYII